MRSDSTRSSRCPPPATEGDHLAAGPWHYATSPPVLRGRRLVGEIPRPCPSATFVPMEGLVVCGTADIAPMSLDRAPPDSSADGTGHVDFEGVIHA